MEDYQNDENTNALRGVLFGHKAKILIKIIFGPTLLCDILV